MNGSAARDYGRCGRIAVATPQANPTVEPEFSILLPRSASLHVTRLRSMSPDAATRLVDYLEHIEDSIAAFDSFRPDAFGFACTGSSYLVGAAREAELIAAVHARTGLHVDTATAAIAWSLDRIGARRIALVSPYPATLAAAAHAWWQAAGYEIVRIARVAIASADTRSIYDLRAADAAPVLAGLDLSGLDAIVLSGTGLPSLPLLCDWPHGLPLLSSNACLAARLMDRIGAASGLDGWQQRLAEARR